ncbi:MAG: FKBP-type peptidyl-prolyl cis-trans isomerase [Sphingobacteriaceae bacterium]
MTRNFFASICSSMLVLAGLSACTKTYPTIAEVDTQAVSNYIQSNNLSVQQYHQTGIYYQVTQMGTGPNIDYSTQIPLIYTIKTLDGTYASIDTFNNRYGGYFGYFKPDSLREVIKSALLKQGGSIRVIVPSRFAFGKAGSGNVPGNSSVDFTVTALTSTKLAEYDDFTMLHFMQANNLTGFSKAAEGYYYKISDPGSGTATISETSSISVEYTGKTLNGTIFDQTTAGSPATFTLGSTVEGWRLALPLLKKGGAMQIILPSTLGYGLAGSGSIAPFSCLFFDIKVTDVAN